MSSCVVSIIIPQIIKHIVILVFIIINLPIVNKMQQSNQILRRKLCGILLIAGESCLNQLLVLSVFGTKMCLLYFQHPCHHTYVQTFKQHNVIQYQYSCCWFVLNLILDGSTEEQIISLVDWLLNQVIWLVDAINSYSSFVVLVR